MAKEIETVKQQGNKKIEILKIARELRDTFRKDPNDEKIGEMINKIAALANEMDPIELIKSNTIYLLNRKENDDEYYWLSSIISKVAGTKNILFCGL